MDLLCFWGAALLQLWFGFRLIRNNFQGGKRTDPPLARSTSGYHLESALKKRAGELIYIGI
jgi:hypothetical protein